MTVGRNLLAGLANSGWTAILGLAVVPLYVKYLGVESYGLIGFFVTTQSVLLLLDLGLSPTINREVARCSAAGKLADARNLLHTFALIYWGMALLIGIVFVMVSPLISEYWLRVNVLSKETVTVALTIMGVVIACRWPVGLYQGALMGAQRLTISSGVNIAMVTLNNLGAVAVLVFISRTIEAFFMWQAAVAIAHALTMRWAAWSIVGRTGSESFEFSQVKRLWRFSAGVSGVALSAVILMQSDKILLSKILSLDEFGRYTLAAFVASGLYVLLTPVFNTIYPRLSTLVVKNDETQIISFYRLGTRLLSATLFPIAITGAFFSEELLHVWTGDLELALAVAPIVSLFLIGTSLNGAMHFPYALQLASGMAKLPLMINSTLILILVPTTIVLALNFGAVGGAAAWVILNFLYLLYGTWMTHRYLLKGLAIKWLLLDVAMPLGLSTIIIGAGAKIVDSTQSVYYVNLASGIGFAILACLMIVFTSPHLLEKVRNGLMHINK